MSPLLTNKRRIDLYFHKRGGIDIMANVAHALSLQEGDVLNLFRTDTEVYLYVSLRAADIHNPLARFRNAVRRDKKGKGHWRCQCIDITNYVNCLTNAEESWLFVGAPREITPHGTPTLGLPLITSNNQFGKPDNPS